MTGEDNTFSQSSSLYAKAHTAFFMPTCGKEKGDKFL